MRRAELWALLKSDDMRPLLETSYDPLLRTITLPKHMCWPVSVSGSTLLVRYAHEKLVRAVMVQYYNHCQRENIPDDRYGYIIQGSPGVGKCQFSSNSIGLGTFRGE